MTTVWTFDVAVVPAALKDDGHRDISRPTWVGVVVSADDLVEAHLTAGQMVGVHGMVIEVLYRE